MVIDYIIFKIIDAQRVGGIDAVLSELL